MAATIKYDTLGVFVGPANVSGNVASGDISQLHRVQSSSYSIELLRENVVSLGSAFANDGNVRTPFASLTIDYLVTNGENEKKLGLVVDGSQGTINNVNSGERDFFILLNKEQVPSVLAVGNGLLTKYSINARVNDFLRASAEVRGHNLRVDAGTSGNFLPFVDRSGIENSSYTYQLPELSTEVRNREAGVIEDNVYVGSRHIIMRFPSGALFGTPLSGSNKSHLQSFSVNIDLGRNEITQIGDKYPLKRCLALPTEVTLNASMLLREYEVDAIQNYFCQGATDLVVDIISDSCGVSGDFWQEEDERVKLKYIFKGLKLKSFSANASIDNRKEVNAQWSVMLGNLLDVSRNFFISGDFGRYRFPLEQSLIVSGEQGITGQGLAPFSREVRYKRTKVDVKQPDFNARFISELETSLDDPDYAVYYQGSSGAVSGSGTFGQNLTEENYLWNSDSFSTNVNGVAESGYTQKYSTFISPYAVGYTGLYDTPSGTYNFYIKGEGFHTEPVKISFANMPTWLSAAVEYPTFTIDPYKPYFFNQIYLNTNSIVIPTGTSVDFQIIASNSKLKRAYTLNVTTPYSFHVSLPPENYRSRTSLFLQPYNETTVTRDSSNVVSTIENFAPRSGTFNAVTGITYGYNLLNGKSYLTFGSGSMLQHTGGWMQDFRNFTMFAVYRPSGTATADSKLLYFYHTDTGVANYKNEAFFKRRGSSQDLEFYYVNPTGATGSYTGAHINVTSGWSDGWNISEIVYDGVNGSGYYSGQFQASAAFGIPQSGTFNMVQIGGGGFEGDIAELILFPYRLLSSERTHVREYLKYKWGFE